MLEYAHGNLLQSDVEALVNTVNTVGVMGKGIALQVRQAFPRVYEVYRRACARGEVQLGRVQVVPTERLEPPCYVLNFPTKGDWRQQSRLVDIESGLDDLVRVLREYHIHSVAVPPLGCGNGGLDWGDVRPRIERALAGLPDVRVLLYAPEGAPAATTMPVGTTKPHLTQSRALMLSLLSRYLEAGEEPTRLVAQKLAYFLHIAGVMPKLRFVAGTYGPYADTLNHALVAMEGHWIRGFGDRTQSAAPFSLLPGAGQEADARVASEPEAHDAALRVTALVDGFESPYSLELLATIHWLAVREPHVREDASAAIAGVGSWSARKRAKFQPRHIIIAWQRLRDQGWI
jgi:O-acetyl-ADP-ribose deacetylase (regulator of RNase III)